MALLLIRLVWRNIRRRPLAALLLLIAMTTVTTTLSLALTVRATAEAPWDDTFNRTSGAHVLANSEDPNMLTALLHAPGVVVGIGPDPMVPGSAQIDGYTIPLEIVGRTTLNTQVDRPLITVGSANLGGAAIVLEQSTAAALHAVVGDRVTIGATALTVSGVALSVAHPPFPRSEPGLAWTSTATAQRLATALGRAVGQIELRLARPADAESFLTAHADPQVYLTSWDQTRTSALQDTATIRVILLTVSVLLVILTLGSVTVLVAGRTFEQIRQVGILKAVGLTPRAVTAMVLVEQLSTAVVATIIGVTLGPRLAGLIVQPLAGLLHTAGPAGPTPGTVSMVAGAAVGIVLIAAARPARAAARASTVNNLTTGLGPPRPTPRTAAAAAALHLPLPMSLGVRSMLRRPTRTLLGIVSYALSVALATAALHPTHPAAPKPAHRHSGR